jgi:enterochelin esterase-like enzyme
MRHAITVVLMIAGSALACSTSAPPGDVDVAKPPSDSSSKSGGSSGGSATGGSSSGGGSAAGGATGGSVGQGGATGGASGVGGSSPAATPDADVPGGAGGQDPGVDGGGAGAPGGPTESDPGTTGDGEFHLLPPYNGAPADLQVNPNVPKGTVTADMTVPSKLYPGRNFVYRIYVPAQYDKGRAAALMVTQDGYQFVDRFKVAYDNLIAAKKVPITIVVFVDPTDRKAQRSEQYDTVSAKYGDFVMQELLPPIKAMYNITDDPAGRALSGNSSGGIAAFLVAWYKPEAFHRVLTSSGTFVNIKGGNKCPMLIMDAEKKPLRVYLSSSEGDNGGWLPANKAMAAALMAKGYHHRFIWGDKSIPHGGGPMFNGDIPTALEWVWRGYHQP